MELRSKSQQGTTGSDAAGRDFMAGEGDIRPAHDPSLPILSPGEFQATPVRSDDNVDDAEQPQEQSDHQLGLGISTLEPPVRIDPAESAIVRPVASGSLVSLDKQSHLLSKYPNVVVTNVSLPAAASVMGTGSVSGASQGDVDDEVASYMTLKSPGPFRGPPSRASRRSVSRSQSTLSLVIPWWN